MTTDESLTLYAAVYDADNNYLEDVSVDWTNTGSERNILIMVLVLHLTAVSIFYSGTIIH